MSRVIKIEECLHPLSIMYIVLPICWFLNREGGYGVSDRFLTPNEQCLC